jgi:hypothetical protein
MKRRYRPTGFDRAVVAQAKDRDQRCVVQMRCDGEETDPRHLVGNHIVNRGLGGSSDPEINAVTNCLTVCHLDNGWLEDHPLIAYRYGWKRRHGAPSFGVLYPDGFWYALLPSGMKRLVAAPEAEDGAA